MRHPLVAAPRRARRVACRCVPTCCCWSRACCCRERSPSLPTSWPKPRKRRKRPTSASTTWPAASRRRSTTSSPSGSGRSHGSPHCRWSERWIRAPARPSSGNMRRCCRRRPRSACAMPKAVWCAHRWPMFRQPARPGNFPGSGRASPAAGRRSAARSRAGTATAGTQCSPTRCTMRPTAWSGWLSSASTCGRSTSAFWATRHRVPRLRCSTATSASCCARAIPDAGSASRCQHRWPRSTAAAAKASSARRMSRACLTSGRSSPCRVPAGGCRSACRRMPSSPTGRRWSRAAPPSVLHWWRCSYCWRWD